MVRVSKQNDTDIYSTYIFSEIYSSRFFNNTNFEIRKKSKIPQLSMTLGQVHANW